MEQEDRVLLAWYLHPALYFFTIVVPLLLVHQRTHCPQIQNTLVCYLLQRQEAIEKAFTSLLLGKSFVIEPLCEARVLPEFSSAVFFEHFCLCIP
jgi:hypothetical protein